MAFVHEGAWRYTYNVGNYSQLFQETFGPNTGTPVNYIPWTDLETAQKRAAKDGKKIFVQVFNQNSMTGTITDRKTLQHPSTVEYLKKHYHCVKLNIEEQDSITYKGRVFKNVGGFHQLALLFSDNQITSPMLIFLDAEGNRISKVSDYFEIGELDIVLAFFHEEAYKKGIQFSDFKKSKQTQVKQ